MPKYIDKNGVENDLTPEEYAHVTGCKLGQTLCRDNICRNLSGIEATRYKPGKDWTGVGGKIKGTKNRITIEKEEALENIKNGMGAKEYLLGIVNNPNYSHHDRMKAAEKVIKFQEPALSAVEVYSGDEEESPFVVVVKKTTK